MSCFLKVENDREIVLDECVEPTFHTSQIFRFFDNLGYPTFIIVVFVIWKRPLTRLDPLRGSNKRSLPSLTASLPVIAGGIRSLPQRVPGGWHGESFQGRVNGQLVVGIVG